MEPIPPPDFMKRVDPYWVQDPRKLSFYTIPIEGYQTASANVNVSTPIRLVQSASNITTKTSAAANHTSSAAVYAVGATLVLLSLTWRIS